MRSSEQFILLFEKLHILANFASFGGLGLKINSKIQNLTGARILINKDMNFAKLVGFHLPVLELLILQLPRLQTERRGLYGSLLRALPF